MMIERDMFNVMLKWPLHYGFVNIHFDLSFREVSKKLIQVYALENVIEEYNDQQVSSANTLSSGTRTVKCHLSSVWKVAGSKSIIMV